MLNCNIQESATVFNYAKERFFDAFMLSKGNADVAFRLSIKEAQKKFPDFKLNPESFIEPMTQTLKENGIVKENYKFGKSGTTKIERITSKFKGLNPNQKRKFVAGLFEGLNNKGMLGEQEIKNVYAEALGLPSMTIPLQTQMDGVVKDMEAHEKVLADIDELNKELASATEKNTLTEELQNIYQERANKLKKEYKDTLSKTIKSNQDFSNKLAAKRFWLNTYADMMLMNLMSVPALVKNLTGAVADAAMRQMSNAVSTPIVSAILRKNLVASRYKGGFKSAAMKKAGITWMTGAEAKFTKGLVPPNYLNSIREFKDLGERHGFDKVIGAVWGFLKLHPDFVSRSLQSVDAGVYAMIEGGELYRIGKEKGLTGAQLDLFLLKPDAKSAEIAKDKASKGTFKQDVAGIDTFFKKITGEHLEKSLIAKNWNPTMAKYMGGIASVMKAITVPFVKTPINMIKIAARIVLPEAGLIRGLKEAKNATGSERYKIIAETLATASIGFHIRIVAMNMVALGLISGGYDDEDEKTREAVDQELGGPNRLNFSAFMRGLFFGNMKPQKGDTKLDLSSLGAMGIALGSYAHAYGKRSKKDIEEQVEYTKNWNSLTVPGQSLFHLVGGALDNTFFSGINQLNKTIKDVQSGNSKTGEKYFANSLATILGGIGNGTYQKLSKAATPEKKVSYDKDKTFGENLKIMLGYRFAFAGQEAKNKYYLLSKDLKGASQKRNVLFDNYLGQVLSEMSPFHLTGDSEHDAIHLLFEESRNVPKEDRAKLFPPKISDKITTRKGKINLTTEQQAFLEEQASVMRMIYAKPFLESEEFKKADFETKTQTLQNLYKSGLKQAEKTVIENFNLKAEKDKSTNKKTVKKLTKRFTKK